MDEKELEALKTSNPKAYEHIVSQNKIVADAKAASDKAAADAKAASDKAAADKAAADKGGTGDDLRDKVRKDKEAADKGASDMRAIEKVVQFNLGVNEFVKANSDVLPSEISDLLKVAEKEKYDSATEKAAAVKTAFIQSFFAVQAHVDLLTTGQKATLDDYLKLTKNGKQEKAESVYENLFEPALETLKKVKKAEELGKSRMGFAPGSKMEDNYKARLAAGSRKHYLKEGKGA